ncbi:MATE family efflux transporter [Thalassotalea fusca]
MSTCNSQSFTTAPVALLLWRNSAPMLSAILALFAYELLESTLLAFQDESTLTAFGFTLPITAAMTALAIGLSIHANNKTVHCNCVEKEKLAQTIVTTLITNTIVVAVFSLLFMLGNEQLLFVTGNANWTLATTHQQSIQEQSTYMHLRYLGWIFMALFWQINAVLRALGWMKVASYLMLGWALTKGLLATVVLTPQSPFFAEGLSNLAMVHVLADILFAVISLLYLFTKVAFVRPQFRKLSLTVSMIRIESLLIVLQQFIPPISMAALTAIAASLSTDYVAALALLFRLEAIFLIVPMALTTSMPALVGANYWLSKKERVKSLYQVAFSAVFLIQIAIAVLLMTQSHYLSSFVCPHEAIAQHLDNYLNWVPWGYATAGIVIVFQSCLNAKKKALQATLLAISHRLLFILPLAAIGALTFSDVGFYQGLFLGHLAAIIPVIFLLSRFGYLRKQDNSNNQILTEGITHENNYSR